MSGANDAAPFTNVRVKVNKTPAQEKDNAYTSTKVNWLEQATEGQHCCLILLETRAGLRV